MKMFKAAALFALGFAVSGCAATDTTTRNAPFETNASAPAAIAEVIAVDGVEVHVSRSLKVSEAELYFPVADIVWRGDARGDRHAQVGQIFQTSAEAATQDLKQDGGQAVKVVLDVLRFHAQSDKARYTIGGVHSLRFMMSVKDAQSGVDLIQPRKIKADLKGYGGQAAIQAETRGETQKKRITDHLTRVIRAELAAALADVAGPVVTRDAQAVDALPKGQTAVY